MKRPCLVFAVAILALPSAVLGPVAAPPCSRQRRFPAMGYFAHGLPERVFAPHLRGLVVGSFIGLCSYINFVACGRGLTRLVQIQKRARRMSHICVTSDT